MTENKLFFNPKDVYGPQDAFEGSEVLQYINKIGYFGVSLEGLQKGIERGNSDKLYEVYKNTSYPYRYSVDNSQSTSLFLPADKVTKPESKKVLRPVESIYELYYLTGKSYGNDFSKAQPIRYRCKADPEIEFVQCITGIKIYKNDLTLISLGACSYNPRELLTDYEIYNSKTRQWVAIGVEEDEKDGK